MCVKVEGKLMYKKYEISLSTRDYGALLFSLKRERSRCRESLESFSDSPSDPARGVLSDQLDFLDRFIWIIENGGEDL